MQNYSIQTEVRLFDWGTESLLQFKRVEKPKKKRYFEMLSFHYKVYFTKVKKKSWTQIKKRHFLTVFGAPEKIVIFLL